MQSEVSVPPNSIPSPYPSVLWGLGMLDSQQGVFICRNARLSIGVDRGRCACLLMHRSNQYHLWLFFLTCGPFYFFASPDFMTLSDNCSEIPRLPSSRRATISFFRLWNFLFPIVLSAARLDLSLSLLKKQRTIWVAKTRYRCLGGGLVWISFWELLKAELYVLIFKEN